MIENAPSLWQTQKQLTAEFGRAPGTKVGYAYHVPFRAILPQPEQCENLLVPLQQLRYPALRERLLAQGQVTSSR